MTKRLSFSLIIFLSALFYTVPATAAVTWVGNMFPGPGSANTRAEGTPLTIYVQAYKAGVTDAGGQGAGITCEVYYGEVINFGDAWLSTNSVNMTYNLDIGNNDEYQGNLSPSTGNYEFTCRCSDDGGTSWTYVNLGGAGNGRLTVDAPVPVDLTRFTAIQKQNDVELFWQTASEINSDYFEIQKSNNGNNWTIIGVQNSEGHYRENNYSFLDQEAQRGTNYYRLNMIDFGGQQAFSETRLVDFVVKNQVKVYPNPAKEVIYFETNSGDFDQLELYNSSGQLIRRKNISNEEQLIHLNISDLNAGLYFYRLFASKGAIVVQDRFLKE